MQLVVEALTYAPFPSRRRLNRTRLADVVRWRGLQHASAPFHLVGELLPELVPTLVWNGTLQPRLPPDLLARLFEGAFGVSGHIPDLQILNADEHVVLGYCCGNFVEEVFTGIDDAGVNFLDARFRLPPITAEFDLTAHTALVARQALLVFLEAVERRDEAAVAQGGKAGDPNVNADRRRCFRQGKFDLATGQNRREPLAA